MNLPIYKVVVLGEGRVGKTSMSLKYVHDRFNEKEQSSINASYLEKVQEVNNGKNKIKLAIWDTAGQEKYNAIAPVYYRDALAAIVVYDITYSKSFEKVKKWTTELLQHGPKDIILTIAGNKKDMQSQRQVDNEEAQSFAQKHKAKHFIVSAKNGAGIKELMQNLAQRIHDSKKNDNKMISMRSNQHRSLTVDKVEEKKTKNKKQCCS